jgi:BON domain
MATFSKVAVATLLATAMLGFTVGCSKHASDDTISKDIQNRVAADPDTKDSNVSVASKDGKVTLTGTASSRAAQKKLEEIARQEPGIAGVDNQTAVPPPPPPMVVPAGTALTVTVDQALSSKTSQAGQTFLATLAQPVTVDGKTAIPKGSSVTGTVLRAKEKGKIKGEGELALSLNSITIHGKNYAIHTGELDSTIKGKGKRTAATTGGGAAGGALIGGIAGGGKGAGIGALVGAAGGFVGGAMTGNKQIEIPAESALTFTLSESLTLPHHPE